MEYRERRGEKVTQDSYLLVKKFGLKSNVKGQPFKGRALWAILEDCISSNSGLREIDHVNPFKRKQIPIFHGFRKFCTKQLIDSKVNPEIREMLLGHKIGLASCYYKPTEHEMLQEYLKAVGLLTINEENRLRNKVRVLEVEKSRLDELELTIKRLEERYKKDANLGSR
jgi:hypothetical protein